MVGGELGTRLRGLRLGLGWGLEEAGRRGGLSKAALSAWENGHRTPRGPALARLLDALGAAPRVKAHLLHLADPQHVRLNLAGSPLGAPVDVGMVLRVLRDRRGMSQADLARRVGVSQAAVSKWESGDAVPSVESIHAAGFALGATVEETLALASAGARGSGGLSDDPRDARDQVWSIPIVLREVSLLGWEAELWRRASRDSRWDAPLAAVLSARAHLLSSEERYGELVPIARRAIALATTTERRMEAVPAVAALADADRHLGRSQAAVASLAETWAEELPDSGQKAWMLRQAGLCLARGGQTANAAERIGRAVEMDLRGVPVDSEAWVHPVLLLCDGYLVAGEAKRADALLAGRRWRRVNPTVFIAVDHANGRSTTDAEMAWLRFKIGGPGNSPSDLRTLERMERRQAWLTGGRSPVPSFDGKTEDELWSAVLNSRSG